MMPKKKGYRKKKKVFYQVIDTSGASGMKFETKKEALNWKKYLKKQGWKVEEIRRVF